MRERTEKLALGLCIPLTGGAVVLLVNANDCRWSDPVFYVGLGLLALTAWAFFGAIFGWPPLPTLTHSERIASRIAARCEEFVDSGQRLVDPRPPIRSLEQLEALKTQYAAWLNDVRAWAKEELRAFDAAELDRYHGGSVQGAQVFNEEHEELQTQLIWQLRILRDIRSRALGRSA